MSDAIDLARLLGDADKFIRHTGLCGIVGGYGYCTCGMNEAREALASRISELESAQEWQPIETAPKDGQLLQLFCAKAELPVSLGYYEDTAGIPWESADRWVMFELDGMVSAFDPTHWRPLPAPPQARNVLGEKA